VPCGARPGGNGPAPVFRDRGVALPVRWPFNIEYGDRQRRWTLTLAESIAVSRDRLFVQACTRHERHQELKELPPASQQQRRRTVVVGSRIVRLTECGIDSPQLHLLMAEVVSGTSGLDRLGRQLGLAGETQMQSSEVRVLLPSRDRTRSGHHHRAESFVGRAANRSARPARDAPKRASIG
jgi:hypothetical protein